MKVHNNCYYVLLVLILFIAGCKKLVETDPPVNKLVTATVFANDNTAIAAQLAIYAQMQAFPWNIEAYTALSSDELVNYSSNQTGIDLYSNNLNAINDGSALFWAPIYKYIYQENAIIENTKASGGITPNAKKLLLGEAEFLRAYLYFYLVNLYGDAPLVTTTNYKINSVMARTPKAQVYAQIIADLTDAQGKLSPTFLDQTDTSTTVDRVRPTSWAASALLARVYLYTGQYDSASIAASNVINNTSLFGLPALSSVFLKNSLEAIWQIMPPSTQLYTYDANYFILTKPPSSSTIINNGCGISTQLLNAFEAGDQRSNYLVLPL